MMSVMMAGNALRAGQSKAVVAGGMESMSRAPYLIPQGRQGYRFGSAEMLDHMQYDGLQDAYQAVPWVTLPRAVPTNITLAAKTRMPMP